MINTGKADDLMGFWEKTGAEGGRSFVHNGLRRDDEANGKISHANVIRYPNGYHAVFVANSGDVWNAKDKKAQTVIDVQDVLFGHCGGKIFPRSST